MRRFNIAISLRFATDAGGSPEIANSQARGANKRLQNSLASRAGIEKSAAAVLGRF